MSLIKGKQIAANSVALSKLTTVGAAQLLVGDADGQIVAATLSGHATISSAGALTLADDAVTTAVISDSAVTTEKIANDAVTLAKISASAFATDLTAATLSGFIAEAAAVKTYVDSVAQGLDIKESVKAATTANLDISASILGATIDGVVLAEGDRVLLKSQTTASENGIYIVVDGGVPTRTLDFATDFSAAGAFVFVESGDTLADTGWVCSSDSGSDIVGTDALSFTQFSSAGIVLAGTGLLKSGNTINLNIDALDEETNVVGDKIDPEVDYILYSDNGTERKIRVDRFFQRNISNYCYPGDVFPNNPIKWAASQQGGPGLTLSLNDQLTAFGTDHNNFDCLTLRFKEETIKLSNGTGVNTGKKVIEVPVPRLETTVLEAAVAATSSTGISITRTPAADQAPILFVNGVKVILGISTDPAADAFFKTSAGVARASLADITATDVLWWSSSSYDLEADDVLELSYTAFA